MKGLLKAICTNLIKQPLEAFIDVEMWLQIAPFDPTKKKKKKKVVIQDSADDSVDSLAEKTENLSGI